MDWLRFAALIALLTLAVVSGGAAVRLAVALGDTQTILAVGLVVIGLLIALRFGARTESWRRNPYW